MLRPSKSVSGIDPHSIYLGGVAVCMWQSEDLFFRGKNEISRSVPLIRNRGRKMGQPASKRRTDPHLYINYTLRRKIGCDFPSSSDDALTTKQKIH